MSVRNAIALLFALSAIIFLAACGGSGGSVTTPVAPPSGGFSSSLLNGTYVFSVSGTDTNGFAFAMVGTLTANGSGTITGGTVDINNQEFSAPVANLPVNSNGSYSISVDGRGTAKIGTTPASPFGDIVLDFVMSSNSHGLIIEFDGNASGSGTIDLQTAGSSPNGTYAFGLSGADSTGNALVAAGNFTLGAGGVIAGFEDFNDNILAYPDETLTGTVILGPSSTPSTQLITSPFGTQTFDVYAIDATHLKFIEMDQSGSPILAGDAYSQSSTTVPTGTMAFTLLGFVSGAPAAAGGFMITDGNGGITGTEDTNNNGAPSTTPVSFTGAYAAAGTGRFTISNLSGFFGGTTYAAYPSSGGLLLLEIDNTNIMSGAAYLQSSTAFTASQGYALNFSGINLGAATGTVEEVDDIAEFTGNSSGATVTGLVDENYAPAGSPIFGQALSGTYLAPDANGRGAISASAGSSSQSTLNGGFGITFYSVDGTTFPFIETDANGQVASGVFVAQTSSSASGAVAHSQLFMARPLVHARTARQKKN